LLSSNRRISGVFISIASLSICHRKWQRIEERFRSNSGRRVKAAPLTRRRRASAGARIARPDGEYSDAALAWRLCQHNLHLNVESTGWANHQPGGQDHRGIARRGSLRPRRLRRRRAFSVWPGCSYCDAALSCFACGPAATSCRGVRRIRLTPVFGRQRRVRRANYSSSSRAVRPRRCAVLLRSRTSPDFLSGRSPQCCSPLDSRSGDPTRD
jgi:hypothetical protein